MDWVVGIVIISISVVVGAISIILRSNGRQEQEMLDIIRKRRPKTSASSASRALEIMAQDMRGKKLDGN